MISLVLQEVITPGGFSRQLDFLSIVTLNCVACTCFLEAFYEADSSFTDTFMHRYNMFGGNGLNFTEFYYRYDLDVTSLSSVITDILMTWRPD